MGKGFVRMFVCVRACLSARNNTNSGAGEKNKRGKRGGEEEIFLKDNQITKIYNAIQIGGEKVLFFYFPPPSRWVYPRPPK